MPVTALNRVRMTLFVAFCTLVCAVLHADTHADVVDLFASMTAALSADNAAQFMRGFDARMPDRDKLKDQIAAMLDQAEVASSVELLRDEGDDERRTVELDWYLELRSRSPEGPLLRRREVVRCGLQRENKRWRIVSLAPLDFLAAPRFDSAKQK
jgi:hypothetical protein